MSEHQIDMQALGAIQRDFTNGPLQVLVPRFAEILGPRGIDPSEIHEALEATFAAGVTTGAICADLGIAGNPAMLEAWLAVYRSAFEHGVRYLEYAEGRP